MADIHVGDNGIIFEINIFEGASAVDLNGAVITGLFVRGDRSEFPKTFDVEDPETGKCTTELLAADLTVPGDYFFQVTAMFNGGKEYTGPKLKFKVKPRLTAGNAERV